VSSYVFLSLSGYTQVTDCLQLNARQSGGASGGGEEGSSARLQAPQTPQNQSLENSEFVAIVRSKVLHDLAFSQNQPLKSPED
jgi:hypothetical protein